MYNKEYREKNKEKMNEAQRRYDQRNRVQHEESRLQSQYGISSDQYMEMVIEQDGRCAICGTHQSCMDRVLAIDHNHRCCPEGSSCGYCIRGLLCNKCNSALGLINDSIEIIDKMRDYIIRYEK